MSSRGQSFPTWLVEFVNGPLRVAEAYPMYCTRGYAFKILRPKKMRPTCDYGVSAQSGDLVYYGILREILEVRYPGFINLRCIVFLCDWYNPHVGHGVKHDEFGVTTIHTRKKLREYDPFILASQADQVCYIRYPRVAEVDDPWITVISVNPRGRIVGISDDSDHDPMQQNSLGIIGAIDHSLEVDLVVDFTIDANDEVFDDSEEEFGEFEDSSSSENSEYSQDDEDEE